MTEIETSSQHVADHVCHVSGSVSNTIEDHNKYYSSTFIAQPISVLAQLDHL